MMKRLLSAFLTLFATTCFASGFVVGGGGGGGGGPDTTSIARDGSRAPTANTPWGSFKITSLADPTLAQDAATKNYVDTQGFITAETDPLSLHLDGGNSPSADISWGDFDITDLGEIVFTGGASLNGVTANEINLTASVLLTLTTPEARFITAGKSTYDFGFANSGNGLQLSNINSGEDNEFIMRTADSDGTDYNAINIFGLGDWDSEDVEGMRVGWDVDEDAYYIHTIAYGTGIHKNVKVGAPDDWGTGEATLVYDNTDDSLHPDLDNSTDLGNASFGFKDFYLHSSAIFTGSGAKDITVESPVSGSAPDLTVAGGDGTIGNGGDINIVGGVATDDGSVTPYQGGNVNITAGNGEEANGGDVVIQAGDATDTIALIGTDAGDIYLRPGESDLNPKGVVWFDGNVVPEVDATYDFGDGAHRFANIYFYSALIGSRSDGSVNRLSMGKSTLAADNNRVIAVRAGTATTTDATPTTVVSDAVIINSVTKYIVDCVARQTDNNNRAGYRKQVLVYRGAAAAPVIEGSDQTDFEVESNAAWDFAVSISGNSFVVTATGAAATTIVWVCNMQKDMTSASFE